MTRRPTRRAGSQRDNSPHRPAGPRSDDRLETAHRTNATARVSVIFGTRPEAIKLCPVVRALRLTGTLSPHVCVTAQHREMLDQVLRVFDVVPDADLDLMVPDQTLAALTARVIGRVDDYLAEARPDLLIVQGDTTTTLGAALAAFYRGIPVAHVEAGLRTGDFGAPFPEEMNRVLTSRIATHHFAPTATSRDNLLREGVPPECVSVTGNTVIDALEIAIQQVRRAPPRIPGLAPSARSGAGPLVLITGHRRENFGPGFESICGAIRALAVRFPDARFVYPVHLNPNVREPVHRLLGSLANVHLIEPLDYLQFVSVMDQATIVLTDSGGIQEEAPTLRKPLLVMRETTERPEVVEAGVAKLVGTDRDRIVAEVAKLLSEPAAHAAMARGANPYGDGTASRRIVETCVAMLRGRVKAA